MGKVRWDMRDGRARCLRETDDGVFVLGVYFPVDAPPDRRGDRERFWICQCYSGSVSADAPDSELGSSELSGESIYSSDAGCVIDTLAHALYYHHDLEDEDSYPPGDLETRWERLVLDGERLMLGDEEVGHFGTADGGGGWRASIRIDRLTGTDMGRYIGDDFESEDEARAWVARNEWMADVYTRPDPRALTLAELHDVISGRA